MKNNVIWASIWVAAILTIAVILSTIVAALKVDVDCLSMGYSDSSITFSLQGYCKIEIRETDYVIPLNEAKLWMDTKSLKEAPHYDK